MTKKIENVKESLDDSGIVEDISNNTPDDDRSEYEKIRDENIRERIEMWNYLGLQSSSQECKPKLSSRQKGQKRKTNEVKTTIRKSARLAAKEDVYETILRDLQSEVIEKQKSVEKPKLKNRKKRKFENFEQSTLVFNVSFSSRADSKKLFISYWS